MTNIGHVDWGTVFAATTSLAALILSYLSFRRGQNIRRDTIHDRRTAQARLVTAWWTRVRKDTLEDLVLGDTVEPEWPAEAGYRIWVSNSSDDAVYDCMVFAPIEGTPKLAEQLINNPVIWRPYISYDANFLVIGVGTIPPKSKTPYRIDQTLVSSIGKLRIEFTDSDSVDWRRVAGKLTERTATGNPSLKSGGVLHRVAATLRERQATEDIPVRPLPPTVDAAQPDPPGQPGR